jgi:hypothetical protein
VAGSTIGAGNLIGSSLIVSTGEWIQSGSDTSSIELNVKRRDIEVVRELWEAEDEVVRGNIDRNGDIEAEFINIPQLGTVSWQEPREEDDEQRKNEVHLEKMGGSRRWL